MMIGTFKYISYHIVHKLITCRYSKLDLQMFYIIISLETMFKAGSQRILEVMFVKKKKKKEKFHIQFIINNNLITVISYKLTI